MVYLDSVASSRSDSRTLVMRQRIEAVLREVDPEREEEFRGVPWSYSAPVRFSNSFFFKDFLFSRTLAELPPTALRGLPLPVGAPASRRKPHLRLRRGDSRTEVRLGAEAPELPPPVKCTYVLPIYLFCLFTVSVYCFLLLPQQNLYKTSD
ncbi:hypothetical protein L596_027948 [Steinernema carpocapsae]|uniref:Uncharacterized protein n=1 Tax=Steinernema carpocapsae TaxID=34508 RepID=A0A4U5LX05_STECR|nr:hypothetical protein L596_027948 [Steinernema carpocapsae]